MSFGTVISAVQYSLIVYEWVYKPFFMVKNNLPIQLVLWNSTTQTRKESETRSHDDLEVQQQIYQLKLDLLNLKDDHFITKKRKKFRRVLKRRHSI